MDNRNTAVDDFLAALIHPDKYAVASLRDAILRSDPDITESVKWNAPNFRYAGEDRVTFRLQPKNCLELIFHRGATVRDDTDAFTFADDTGLLRWVAPDRGVVSFKDGDEAEEHEKVVIELVNRWVRA
ncbi:MAG: hypothetical protein JWM93_525 [Frankiales bacterium]|nr:hypothetical protein [Frankiales bacterium]